MEYAPIALFTYNRLTHTKKTIESLLTNDLANESELFIFCDGAKNDSDVKEVTEVKNYLKSISGFKKIHITLNDKNVGLANSIIIGVSSILIKHEYVIVLEDDLETSPIFLTYMNNALQYYNPNKIWSIAGYAPPIIIPDSYSKNTYLAHRNCSWGWATWKSNWEKTDWKINDFTSFFKDKKKRSLFERGGNDLSIMLLKQQQNKISSWSIRFNYNAFKNNLPSVYPTHSLVKNIGVDGSGTNMKKSGKYGTEVLNHPMKTEDFCDSEEYNLTISKRFKKFYSTSFYRRIINLYKKNKALKYL